MEQIRKARKRATRSVLEIDWNIFDSRRQRFEEENRKAKRRFHKRTEELLARKAGNRIANSVKRDKRRREERHRETSYNNN